MKLGQAYTHADKGTVDRELALSGFVVGRVDNLEVIPGLGVGAGQAPLGLVNLVGPRQDVEALPIRRSAQTFIHADEPAAGGVIASPGQGRRQLQSISSPQRMGMHDASGAKTHLIRGQHLSCSVQDFL